MTAVINDARVELERDRGLVEQHQAGDHAAFTELYALHYGRLVRFCTRLTRDPHSAEEIAQEAFTRAFASMTQLQGERRFYPWLTVIARRLVIDAQRLHGRVETRPDLEPGFARAAEDIAVQRIDGDHVALAVGRLSERHREVLRLRDWEGLSYGAIAQRLQVPETTIPPLLFRARAALRREYLGVSRSRVAAWLHLAPLFAAARRTRDRLAMWAAQMPDPSIFAAPMAGAALGAAALLVPQTLLDAPMTGVRLDAPAGGGLHVPGQFADNPPSAGAEAGQTESHPGQKHPLSPNDKLRDAGVRPEETVLRYVMESDPATAQERREGARRMAIYYEEENTGWYIAVHPESVTEYGLHLLGR